MFKTVFHCFASVYNCLYTVLQGFDCPFYYFAKINGCQCDNAPQEELLTMQVLTTVFPLFYKCLQMFFFIVLQVFTIVFFFHCFCSVLQVFTMVYK